MEFCGKSGKIQWCIDGLAELFDACHKSGQIPLIYYTGHGDVEGNWCFPDGTMTFEDVESYHHTHSSGKVVHVICDCCFSGMWAVKSNKLTKMNVFAAPAPDDAALDLIFSQAAFYGSAEHLQVLRDLKAVQTRFNGKECVLKYY
mmetsp:Transcript_96231/g.299086  ORF Transcript_96231/g.299086 Transcript_96231/m.299086 type:complete len:145 (+) Transcript_96231:302-736(+)